MKKVRAKFECHHIVEREGGGKEIRMIVVTSGSEENESFSEYTPAGDLFMIIDKGEAKNYFKEGKSYFLDFTETE